MTTRAAFVDKLRSRLNDPSARRWSDLELEDYLDEGCGEYSKLFPRTREVEFTPDGESDRYDVPADLLDDWITHLWVITSDDTIYEVAGPKAIFARDPERRFSVVGQELVLTWIPPITETIRIRYLATYEIPQTGDALIPKEDESLVYIWAEHLAWRKIGAADAALSRWTEDKARNDSPIIPQYVMLEREWRRMVDEKKAGGRVLVRRRAPRFGRDGYMDRNGF